VGWNFVWTSLVEESDLLLLLEGKCTLYHNMKSEEDTAVAEYMLDEQVGTELFWTVGENMTDSFHTVVY
jgi:hypothetical protein